MKEKTQVNKIRHEENPDSNKIQNVSRKYLDSKVLYLKHHIIQNTGKYRRSSKAQVQPAYQNEKLNQEYRQFT